MCDQWFWAEDDDGDYPPFDVEFVLKKWDGSEYVIVGLYSVPASGLSLDLDLRAKYEAVPILDVSDEDDWNRPYDIKFLGCVSDVTFVYERIIEEIPELAFSNVAVSRRYGNRLYLSGFLDEIASSDEICVYYRRPGDDGIRNLKSDTSNYLYFKGASGNYDLGANGRYIEFERSGYHWLKVWDVSGNCESLLSERASWLMNITLPRFQYQVIFDVDDPDLIGNLWRLEAEYARFDAAGSWFVNHEDPDCFPHVQPINTPYDDTPCSVWLNLAVEYGDSPCAPIPYYLCPFPTPQTQYWRGECSCEEFRTTLQPLGIPCSHLIAAMKWYAGKPAYSSYVVCP